MPSSSSRGVFLSYQIDAPTLLLPGELREQLLKDIPGVRVEPDDWTHYENLQEHLRKMHDPDNIRETVGSCAVLVALIGPKWAPAADEQGHRRPEDPQDKRLRLAIQAALEQGIEVIPALVNGAEMPSRQQLPSELRELAQFSPVRVPTFRPRWDPLIARIKLTLAMKPDIGQGAARGLSRPGISWADSTAASLAGARAEQTTRAQGPKVGRPKIFLCYRREDTQGFARGIYENLADNYGHEQVFHDIDSIPPGVRWSTWIESRVSQCSVMIVLIGNIWLSAKDNAGKRRLDSSKDWVRQEIKAALTLGIPIIPVRVQGAPMPSEEDLPPSIADLTGFQSAEVTDSRWAFDVGQLVEAIDNLVASG